MPLEIAKLNHHGHEEVHDGTDGCIVVQSHERIHAHLVGTQHNLHHDQPNRLENDTPPLIQKPNPRKLNLAKTREPNAQDNDQDVEEGPQIRIGDAPDPGHDEDDDGAGGLEHLDKGHGEVQVDDVGADQGARVEDADGQDGAHVDAAVEAEGVSRVEERRGAGEELGREGGEEEVPCREEDSCDGVRIRHFAVSVFDTYDILMLVSDTVRRSVKGVYVRKPAVSISHLLNNMVMFEKKIQLLHGSRSVSTFEPFYARQTASFILTYKT